MFRLVSMVSRQHRAAYQYVRKYKVRFGLNMDTQEILIFTDSTTHVMVSGPPAGCLSELILQTFDRLRRHVTGSLACTIAHVRCRPYVLEPPASSAAAAAR